MSQANPSAGNLNSESKAGSSWAVEVHLFACGHGDTVLLRLPGGETHLIDCCLPKIDGTRGRFFAYLDALGVERLESVFLSHPDQDHFLGMADVIHHFMADRKGVGAFRSTGPSAKLVKELLHNKRGGTEFIRLVHTLQENRVNRQYIADNVVLGYPKGWKERIGLVPISPSANTLAEVFEKDVAAISGTGAPRFEANDLSIVIVLALSEGDCHANVLLTGDAGPDVLDAALSLWDARAAELGQTHYLDAVKIPHHGSSKNYFKRLSARDAKISAVRLAAVSAGDRKALPDRRVLAAFLNDGWRVLATRPRGRQTPLNLPLPSRAVGLIDRSPCPPAPPEGHHDIVLKWSPVGGLTFVPSMSEIKESELDNYDVASA